MATFEMTSTMIKTLKGAPLSVLMLLVLAKQPVSAQYLERESGYSDKAVNSALLYLAEHGLITRNGRYSWQIANGVKALPLMNLEIEESSCEILPEESVPVGNYEELTSSMENVAIINDKSDSIGGTRRKSESEKFRLPVPSSSSSISLKDPKELEPPLLGLAESEKIRVDSNKKACERAGIEEPTRSVISEMPHVTDKLIRYHTRTAPNIALAIYRIKKGWKIKAGWEDEFEPPQIIEVRTDPGQDEPLPAEALRGWETALNLLEKQFKRVEYETWIKSLTLSGYGVSGYVLRTGNKCGTDWLNAHALTELEAALNAPVMITWG